MLSLILCMATTAVRQDAVSLFKAVSPSVATLEVQKSDGTMSQGSAFMISADGYAATSWHVIEGASGVRARFSDGTEATGSGVVDYDVKADIAIIRLRVADKPFLKLASQQPEIGTSIYCIGAPQGLEFSITDGIVSQIRSWEGTTLLQVSCPISPGNSGGPIVNASGEVLGIVRSSLVGAQNLNFAVYVSHLRSLDKSLPTTPWTQLQKPERNNVIRNGMVKGYDEDTMKEVLESLKVEATEDDEVGGLVFKHAGWEGKVFAYNEDGEILDLGDPNATFCMMQAGKDLEGDPDLEAINQFNWESRWVRAYANDEDKVFIEMDIELMEGVTQANLKGTARHFIDAIKAAEVAFFRLEWGVRSTMVGAQNLNIAAHNRHLRTFGKSWTLVKSLPTTPWAQLPKPLRSNVVQGGMVKGYDEDTMKEVLESIKVEATESNRNVSGLVFKHAGWKGIVLAYNEDGEILDLGEPDATSCLIQVSKDLDGAPDLEALNKFNWDSHWIRAYFADDIFIEMDIELSGGMTQANLKRTAQNFIEAVDSAEAAFFGE